MHALRDDEVQHLYDSMLDPERYALIRTIVLDASDDPTITYSITVQPDAVAEEALEWSEAVRFPAAPRRSGRRAETPLRSARDRVIKSRDLRRLLKRRLPNGVAVVATSAHPA